MMGEDDAALRARFAALRESDATEQPAFALPGRRASVRRPAGRRLAWAAGGTVVALGSALWFAALLPASAPAPAALVLPGWRTPTDSLLLGVADPLPHLSWASLPTAGLGQPPSPSALEHR